MKNRTLLTGSVILSAALLTACATDDPNRRAKTGAAIGAIAGAVLGHQTDSSHGREVGAVVGAVAGAAIGDYMDDQQKEFEDQLAQEQRNKEIEIERLADDTLKLNLNSEVSFDVDSYSIKPSFQDPLNKLADVIRKYDRTDVTVAGHTDSSGSDSYNQRLSENRAQAVASYFASRGITPGRLTTVGYGESQPRADNGTASGRQLNRRVEILLRPRAQ